MNTQQAQSYQKIYKKTFYPLALCFVFIFLIGVLWDYTSFIDSQKCLNDRAMSSIQRLTKARMRYIEQEAKIVDIRITHANTLNKVIQALGMPAFKMAKRSKNSIFTSIFFLPEKDKRFSLSPYGVLDTVDFPKEILKKLPTISPQGEFYLRDGTLYYMRRVNHPYFKQYNGVLILLCEENQLVDTEYKSDDFNIVLSTNTYPFLQPDKLKKTYGPLPNSIIISENSYDHYAIIPETSLILFAKLQEVNAYKIYFEQRTVLWAALALLLLLLLAYHLTFNLLYLKKISKLRYKTNIEEQYEQSIKEREKGVFNEVCQF